MGPRELMDHALGQMRRASQEAPQAGNSDTRAIFLGASIGPGAYAVTFSCARCVRDLDRFLKLGEGKKPVVLVVDGKLHMGETVIISYIYFSKSTLKCREPYGKRTSRETPKA